MGKKMRRVVVFGAFRFFLAVLVVNAHLNVPWYPGSYAVFSFFVISGFLMTLIMNERYGYSLSGMRAFFLNRVLRIFPPYYVAMFFSVILITFLPHDFIYQFNTRIKMPETISEIIKNTVIIGLNKDEAVRMVPLAWALHLELVYYILIGLFAGKNKYISVGWLILSLGYLVFLGVIGEYRFHYRYQIIPAASLPFSIGACMYHYRSSIQKIVGKLPWVTCFPFVLILYLIPFLVPAVYGQSRVLGSSGLPFYLNLFATVLLLSFLGNMPGDIRNKASYKKIDSWLGDLSYPVYLFHWQAGILAAYFFNLKPNSTYLLLAGGLLTLLLAMLEVKFLSGNLEKIRSRVKERLVVAST